MQSPGTGDAEEDAMRAAKPVLFALLLAVLVGCHTPTTALTNVWSASLPRTGPLQKVLVVASGVHQTSRHALEDGLAAELAKQGVTASPAYVVFGEVLPRKRDAEPALRSAGFDGVLTAAMRRHVHLPDADASGFWDYDERSSAPSPPSPGWPYYAQFDEIVDFETSLWSAPDGRLLWSALTETRNPRSGQDFVSSLSRAVVPALTAHGLVGRPTRR
jgi:hypothetical protein